MEQPRNPTQPAPAPSIDDQLEALHPGLGGLFIVAAWLLLVLLTVRFGLGYARLSEEHSAPPATIDEQVLKTIQQRTNQ